MTEQPNETTTLRLNVLGNLEIIREPDTPRPLPSSARACHFLAMLAFKTEYDRQELVDIFWEGQTLHNTDPKEVDRINENLNQVFRHARRALGIDGKEILKSDRGTVWWVKNPTYRLTSDLEEFRRLARSDHPVDWRAALVLVRGRVAQHLPQERKLTDSFGAARQMQREEIKEVLGRLDPNAPDDTLDNQVQHVLDGRYRKDYLREQATCPERASKPPLRGSLAGELPPSSAPASHRTSGSTRRGIRRRWLIAAVLTGCTIGLGIAAWAVRPASSHKISIPPPGSVINAQTGQVAHYVPNHRGAKSESPELETLLWICDVSIKRPCAYPKTNHALIAHRGDTLEVWIRLYNETDTLAPLVGVSVGWFDTYENPEHFSAKQVFNVGVVAFDRPNGKQTGGETGMSLYVQMLPQGEGITYLPSYIPGSTVLTSLSPSFRHPLPDGIMQHETLQTKPSSIKRIWLSNVGAPPSACTECRSQYVRFIHFRVQML